MKTNSLPFNSFLFKIKMCVFCWFNPLTLHDLIVNSPFQLLNISLEIIYENLLLDQDNNFYLISLSILITFLLDIVWIL